MKKPIILITSIVAVVSLATGLAYIHHRTSWSDQHPLSDSKVGFRLLYPNTLPPGYAVKTKTIYIHHSRPHVLKDASIVMSFRKQDALYGIQERRANNEDTTTTKLDNFDPVSKEPTCTQRQTPKGQEYRLCHWIEFGKVSVFEVKLIMQGIYFQATFPASQDAPLSETELNAFIDSLHVINPSGISIMADTV